MSTVELEAPAAVVLDVRAHRRHAWSTRTERPLMVASLLFLAVLCIPIIWPNVGRVGNDALNVANIAIWVVFAADYVVRLHLADSRWQHVRRHPVDLVVVVVPFFRPLRLLRLMSISGLVARRSRQSLFKDLTRFVCIATVAVWVLGAVMLLDFERDAPHSVVHNFADALWLSLGTLTAVPYGDVYPVSAVGKVLCGVMMILGLVLVGAVTAAIAAWMVTFVTGEAEDAETTNKLDAMLSRLEAIEGHVVAAAQPALPVRSRPAVPKPRVSKTSVPRPRQPREATSTPARKTGNAAKTTRSPSRTVK
jgi:voltage-gated potassium channel